MSILTDTTFFKSATTHLYQGRYICTTLLFASRILIWFQISSITWPVTWLPLCLTVALSQATCSITPKSASTSQECALLKRFFAIQIEVTWIIQTSFDSYTNSYPRMFEFYKTKKCTWENYSSDRSKNNGYELTHSPFQT